MDNQFSKGLNLNTRPQAQPFGSYPYGKNGIMFKGLPPQNEVGFNYLSPLVLPAPTIGIIPIDANKAIIFSTNNSISYIGYYEWPSNTYTAILNDSTFPATKKLNFNLDWYITGEFQRNYKNQVVVAFTDKHSNPWFLNADNPDATDSDDLLLFLRSEAPTVSTSVDNGGILSKGAYYVAVRYLKNDGAATGYSGAIGPTLISSPNEGTITDKSLLISISNMDQSYDKVQVAVISRIAGVFAAYELDPTEVSTGTALVIYTGENLITPIGLEEILIPQPVYKTVGTFGQLNDALYAADLTKEPEIDLQQYVNLVKVRVKSELITAIPPPDEHVTGKKRSLLHQEVYGLYLRARIKNGGGYTKPFHIPGNAPTAPDLAAAISPHEVDLGAKVFHTRDTNRNINTSLNTVDTGIWVNNTEVYPNLPQYNSLALGGEDLRGKAVRHHRMPSIAWCKINFYPGDSDYGRNKLDILGLEISNFTLPANLLDKLDGYEILIAKRTLANATVLGQSVLMVEGQPNPSHGTDLNYVSTGGNWHATTRRVNDTHREPDLTNPETIVLTGRNFASAISPNPNAVGAPEMKWRFHSFDLLFNKPAIQPAYLSAQLKMRVNDTGNDLPIGRFIEDGVVDHRQFPIMFIADYTKGIVPTATPSTARVRVVEETKYLPNNVISGKWDNRDQESAFVGEMKWIGLTSDTVNNDLPLSCDYSTANIHYDQPQQPNQRVQWEETYLTNLMDHKLDVYSSFYAQPLVASGQLNPISPISAIVYPGDVFINDYTFHTYGWWSATNQVSNNNDDPSRNIGYKIVRRFVCEAVSNINSRYEVSGNVYSQWWPKSPLVAQPSPNTFAYTFYIYQFQKAVDPNQFGYSKDLNAVNDIAGLTPFNPFFEDITEFPYRIHRGGKLPRQGKSRSWRTFLPLDYYEIQKNRGRIIRVLGKDDQLLIHTEHALFRTQSKAKLETDLLSVTLGTGDIFQFEPQEPSESSNPNGYAGTQHELAAVDTPWGYVFPDADTGQIFSYKKGLKLITKDLSDFFLDNMRIADTNPFRGNGITIGYDPEFDRLLLTVKNSQLLDNTNFFPDYEPTQAFIDTLVAGNSIVYKDGRFQVFKGIYTPGPYSCAACTNPSISNQAYTIDVDAETGFTIGGLIIAPPSPNIPSNQISQILILSDTPGASPFAIEGTNLIVSGVFPLEIGTYILTVRVVTECNLIDDATITINVNAIDGPPIADNAEIYILENTPVNTVVYTVVSEDPNGVEDVPVYTLITPDVPFVINSATGVIKTTEALDASVINIYELTINITDETALVTTITVVIHVIAGTIFVTGGSYVCLGTTKHWTTLIIYSNDIDGAILGIVDNITQSYGGVPIIALPDEPVSGDCPLSTGNNYIIQNIDSSYSIGAANPAPTIVTGVFPLTSGQTIQGNHGIFHSAILVSIGGTMGATNSVTLYVNNNPIETLYTNGDIDGAGSGNVKFHSLIYSATDIIRITLKEV